MAPRSDSWSPTPLPIMNPPPETKPLAIPKPLLIRSAPAKSTLFARLDPTALSSLPTWSRLIDDNKDSIPKNLQKLLVQLQAPLRKLALAVNKSGGWLRVTGANKWHLMPACHCPDARKDYEKFLFPILKTLEYASYGIPYPRKMKPQCVFAVSVFGPPENGEITRKFWRDLMERDVVVLRGFTKSQWKVDSKLYTMDCLELKRGEEPVLGCSEPTILKEFVTVMRTRPTTSPLQVSVCISAWEEHVTDLACHFPEILLPGSQFDLLAYARTHIPGVTLPEIELKAAGAWTGARVGRFSQVALNHGPGVAEWWVVDAGSVARLHDFLLRESNVDIWSEQQWWPDENLLMTEGIGVSYVRQLPGDVLYLGPGVVYWTKCKNALVGLKWSIARKTKRQVLAAFDRDDVDRSLSAGNSLRTYTLATDLLNAEMNSLDEDVVKSLAERLEKRFQEERGWLEGRELVDMGVDPKHAISDCSDCHMGLFYAYCKCEICTSCVCIPCSAAHPHPLKIHNTAFPADSLERLLQRVQTRLTSPDPDCFDPSLATHIDLLKKCEAANVFLTAEKGLPSFMRFETEAEEQARKPKKRPREKSPPVKKETAKEKKVEKKKAEMKELAALLDPTTPPRNEDNDHSQDKPTKKRKKAKESRLEVSVSDGQIQD